jgi:hypothetical protein
METGNTVIYGDKKYRDTWRQEIQRYIKTGNTEIQKDRKYRYLETGYTEILYMETGSIVVNRSTEIRGDRNYIDTVHGDRKYGDTWRQKIQR